LTNPNGTHSTTPDQLSGILKNYFTSIFSTSTPTSNPVTSTIHSHN
jgi:hypothetical protein